MLKKLLDKGAYIDKLSVNTYVVKFYLAKTAQKHCVKVIENTIISALKSATHKLTKIKDSNCELKSVDASSVQLRY